MLVRFVIYRRHEDSNAQLGVFQAIYQLRDSGVLVDYELELVEQELAWLKMHLQSPAILREAWTRRAISWFKPEATRPIEKIRSINRVLEEHGYHVQMIKTDAPGRIIYEDGWQIAAIPAKQGPEF